MTSGLTLWITLLSLHSFDFIDWKLILSTFCIICNNPNYSSTVHVYQTVDVSVDVTNDSSIPSIPPHSPDNRPLLRPIHSSTPTRNEGSTKITSPLKVLNISFQSIKSKLCRLSKCVCSGSSRDTIGRKSHNLLLYPPSLLICRMFHINSLYHVLYHCV
jgi:hypothetical protein